MREIERIPKILKELMKIWIMYPQLRLGQLITNAIENEKVQPDLYYVEDETLIKTLNNYYQKKEIK